MNPFSNDHDNPHYVEDFIDALANGVVFESTLRRVRLASYDVDVLNNMSTQVFWEAKPLTDRQAELVLRLIEKYSRQLKNLDVDTAAVLDPKTRQYRMPLRTIDRSSEVFRDGDHIVMRFPFNQKLIDFIRGARKDLQGSCVWDRDGRVWRFGLTEGNLSFVMAVVAPMAFEVDDELVAMFEELGRMEQQGYEIKLIEEDGGFTITNAATSLQEYVRDHLGGFGADNFLTLADHSALLGYTLSDSLIGRLHRTYGSDVADLICGHRINVRPASVPIEAIFRYAAAVQRFPMLVYCPGPKDQDIDEIYANGHVPPEQIFYRGRARRSDSFDPERHRVYLTSVLDREKPLALPLKISYHNMTYGANRLRWLNSPGKIIYYCTELISRE